MTVRAPLAQRVVTLAAGQVGLCEEGGPNCGPPVERYAGGRSEPWCSHFVTWLYRQCGRPLPGDIEPSSTQHNPLASVKALWANLVMAGYEVKDPQPGDIIVFGSRGLSDKGPGWHVGIVVVVTRTQVLTIEGNWGDKVARVSHLRMDKRIVGYARVPEG